MYVLGTEFETHSLYRRKLTAMYFTQGDFQ